MTRLGRSRVSIHASAREATSAAAAAVLRQYEFQSTPPRGRRLAARYPVPPDSAPFQSTPPRGRRPDPGRPAGVVRRGFNPRLRAGGDGRRPALSLLDDGGFNPRLRAGGDARAPTHLRESSESFQSTPPRGRRLAAPADRRRGTVAFQSTPPRGRRLGADRRDRRAWTVSIHASAREATQHGRPPSVSEDSFNPRLRAGGDRTPAGRIAGSVTVSIHASAREAT